MWEMKAKIFEQAVHHPAVGSGKMSYTIIGCGDLYNQDREAVWCPRTQRLSADAEYTRHVAGSPEAKADYTHIDGFAAFIIATLREPENPENAHLDYVGDTISHKEIAALTEKYMAKKVKFDEYSKGDMIIHSGSSSNVARIVCDAGYLEHLQADPSATEEAIEK